MNNEPFSVGNVLSLLNRGMSFLKGVGIRIGVHLLSIIAAAIVTDSLPYRLSSLDTHSGAGVYLGIYAGLVCLFPRSTGSLAAWAFPTGAGMVQIVLLTLLGIPWQLAILWGGVQTWLLRFILRRAAMGWEWSALPWLFISGVLCLGAFGEQVPYQRLLLILPAVTATALAGYYGYLKFVVRPRQLSRIRVYTDQLRRALAAKTLPERIGDPLQHLTDQSLIAIKALPVPGPASNRLYRELPPIARQIALIQARTRPEAWDAQAANTFSHILKVSEEVGNILRQADIRELPAPEENAASPEARYLLFQSLSRELTKRKADVPVRLHPHIDGLRGATQSIIETMHQDPQDFTQGERFLSRYLPASIKVLDDYIRLSRDRTTNAEVAELLAKSEELLARMEKAFFSEYSSLLRNDAIDLRAELATLDTLLRIEGR